MMGSRAVCVDLMDESDLESDPDTAAVASNQDRSEPEPVVIGIMDDSDCTSESDPEIPSGVASIDECIASLRETGRLFLVHSIL